MPEKNLEELVIRYNKNPIITKESVPYDCTYVLNPGAIKFNDEFLLLLRVADREMISSLTLARSTDGYNFKVDNSPFIKPLEFFEKRGLEDPRITKIEDCHYITYTAFSDHGVSVGLIKTNDFISFERLGVILPPDNKNAVLLPELVNNKYFLYHRPMTSIAGEKREIWSACSTDLKHWGDHSVVMKSSDCPNWAYDRIGQGTVPIRTNEGFLSIYHGASNNVYRLGVALFSLNNPGKLIRRSNSFILAPEKDYEHTGWINNVVFSCGTIIEGDDIFIYYGAADSSICLAKSRVSDLVDIALNY